MMKEYKVKVDTVTTSVFKIKDSLIFKAKNLENLYLNNNQVVKIEGLNENLKHLNLDNNQVVKIENLNENLKSLYLIDNPVVEISVESYNLIKKNKIRVYGVDIETLKKVK